MNDKIRRQGIKSWSKEDRPREKLISQGPQALTSAELLAIFIRTGTREKNALELAREVLTRTDNDLDTLARMSVAQMTTIPGIGEAKAVTIAAALELGRRRKDTPGKQKPKLTSSKDVYDNLYPELADKTEEYFYLVILDRANQVIKKISISKGGVAGTTVDPKVIFRHAVENSAMGIILCHKNSHSAEDLLTVVPGQGTE